MKSFINIFKRLIRVNNNLIKLLIYLSNENSNGTFQFNIFPIFLFNSEQPNRLIHEEKREKGFIQ